MERTLKNDVDRVAEVIKELSLKAHEELDELTSRIGVRSNTNTIDRLLMNLEVFELENRVKFMYELSVFVENYVKEHMV